MLDRSIGLYLDVSHPHSQKISIILRNEEYLLYLFWTAQSMLKIAPLRLPRVYEEALRLLSVLLQNTVLRPVLESPVDSTTYQLLRERSALVDVTCLQELVLPGLYLPQTELLAAAVLSELNSSRSELVCNSKARHVLWLLSFVPWLDAHLTHTDLRVKVRAPIVSAPFTHLYLDHTFTRSRDCCPRVIAWTLHNHCGYFAALSNRKFRSNPCPILRIDWLRAVQHWICSLCPRSHQFDRYSLQLCTEISVEIGTTIRLAATRDKTCP